MKGRLQSQKPPLYFVPTAILCSCGQKVMVTPETTVTPFTMSLKVMCTNYMCPENMKEKKIDLSKFAFTEYEVLDS